MEGNPELQMRNWGREFYLEHSDCEYLFGNEQRKRSHAIRRIMSVYLNSALGYPLTQALKQQAGYSSEGLDVSYDYSTFLRYMNSKMESIPGKRQEMFHL